MDPLIWLDCILNFGSYVFPYLSVSFLASQLVIQFTPRLLPHQHLHRKWCFPYVHSCSHTNECTSNIGVERWETVGPVALAVSQTHREHPNLLSSFLHCKDFIDSTNGTWKDPIPNKKRCKRLFMEGLWDTSPFHEQGFLSQAFVRWAQVSLPRGHVNHQSLIVKDCYGLIHSPMNTSSWCMLDETTTEDNTHQLDTGAVIVIKAVICSEEPRVLFGNSQFLIHYLFDVT